MQFCDWESSFFLQTYGVLNFIGANFTYSKIQIMFQSNFNVCVCMYENAFMCDLSVETRSLINN